MRKNVQLLFGLCQRETGPMGDPTHPGKKNKNKRNDSWIVIDGNYKNQKNVVVVVIAHFINVK